MLSNFKAFLLLLSPRHGRRSNVKNRGYRDGEKFFRNKLDRESWKAQGVLFLRNVVRVELSQAEACVMRELMNEESYMDTVTIDRIVGVDISEG